MHTQPLQIGFFGGTFDPIHFGHINLAIELLEHTHLDHILFCPAFCSPFKTKTPPLASPRQRFAMIQAAIADLPNCSITPIEIERQGPSYTIDTLKQLQRPNTQYHLILTPDSAAHFHKWKSPQEILHIAPLIVAARAQTQIPPDLPYSAQFKKSIVKIRRLDITGTEMRARLTRDLYCGHLIPSKALDYISQHRLYSQP